MSFSAPVSLRRFTTALAVLAVACVSHKPARTAARISRRVPIIGDTITLGSRWSDATKYMKSSADTNVELADGSAAGADGVVVSRSPDGVVHKITLMYTSAWDFDALLRGLRAQLGPPADSGRVRTPNSQRELWVWRDDRTEYTYIRVTSTRSSPSAMAELTDIPASTPPRNRSTR